jgi:serine/threonine-protein kinase
MHHISTEILFEKFEIINCLKKDGHAAVYLSNHIFLNKKIILKTLNTDGLPDNTVLERFIREAKILAGLDHPNIIKVYDFGTSGNFFYISFEYFESKNLREILNKNSLSINDKIQLVIQLLKALNSAHLQNIIHRDIKPENILINSSGVLKIADFGLALVLNNNNITQGATVLGTPGYMSPEQIRGEKTQQTDIFSAGLVCFELFTGKNPVLGSDIGSTINNILNFNYENVAKEIEAFPLKVRQILECMLHTNLSKRAVSASDILKYLEAEPSENKSSNAKRKTSKAYILISLIITIIILSALLLKFYHYGKTADSGIKAGPKIKAIDNPANFGTANSSYNNPTALTRKKEQISTSNNFSNDKFEKKSSAIIPGKITIECFPWAEVFIDNTKIDITPIHAFTLNPGKHKLELIQPDFPPYTKYVNIKPGRVDSINVNFTQIVGYLNCEVYPWGEIYINEKLIGTTPFTKPVALMPGNYNITVKNANYAPVSKTITIKKKQKLNFTLNFEETNNKP